MRQAHGIGGRRRGGTGKTKQAEPYFLCDATSLGRIESIQIDRVWLCSDDGMDGDGWGGKVWWLREKAPQIQHLRNAGKFGAIIRVKWAKLGKKELRGRMGTILTVSGNLTIFSSSAFGGGLLCVCVLRVGSLRTEGSLLGRAGLVCRLTSQQGK